MSEPLSPPTTPAGAVQVATIAASIGALFGFSLGLFVGTAGGRRDAASQAPPAADTAPAPGKPSLTVVPPTAPSALRVDVGAAEDAARLGGAWQAHDPIDERTVALVTKAPASAALALPATAGSYLSVVVRAVGEPTGPLELTARLGDATLATWPVADRWTLVGVALPAAEPGSKLELALAGEPPEGRALAVDRIDVEPLSDRIHWDPSQPAHQARALTGFYPTEGVGTNDATVWSAALDSSIGILLAPTPGDYELVLNGRAFDSTAPTDVGVRINDHSVGVARMTATPDDVTVAIPAGILHDGANEIALTYPKTFKPSKVIAGSEDQRDLAVNLHALDVHPK